MKIAVVGATGQAGTHIAAEATARGHEVIRIARRQNDGIDVVKDVMNLDKADIPGVDVVVDALGFFTPDVLDMHTVTLMHLADLLSGTATRLVVVGGAGSLFVDEEHTVRLLDTPEFPKAFLSLAKAQSAQLDALRTRDDVAWTYVSPAADFRADGVRSGEYVLAGEEFETNDRGESVVSYADYAIAMVDLIESGAHIHERVSVYSK